MAEQRVEPGDGQLYRVGVDVAEPSDAVSEAPHRLVVIADRVHGPSDDGIDRGVVRRIVGERRQGSCEERAGIPAEPFAGHDSGDRGSDRRRVTPIRRAWRG